MSMNAPCKNCPDRHYLCHAECEKYTEFRKLRDEFLERKQKEKYLYFGLWEACRHSKTRKIRKGKPYND